METKKIILFLQKFNNMYEGYEIARIIDVDEEHITVVVRGNPYIEMKFIIHEDFSGKMFISQESLTALD